MEVRSIVPQFGVNYDLGYAGFCFTDGSFISEGIAYFEHWARLSDIRVSHAFVVSGPDEVIEAEAGGIKRATLSQYFKNPRVATFFRKPVGWTPAMGSSIVSAAATQLGDRYAFSLIAARFLADSRLGHLVNRLTGSLADRWVTAALESKHQMYCSMLVAYALNAQPSLAGKGVLARPAGVIEPQTLFEDQVIFEPWKEQAQKCPGGGCGGCR